MRSLPGPLKTAISLGTTSLCHIFKITRKDGVIKRFTDLDQDLVVPSDGTYLASNSIVMSAVSSSAVGGLQAADAKIVFEDTAVAEVDVLRGVYDTAKVEISFIHWPDPSLGKGILLTGQLGSIEATDKGYGNWEIRGLLQRASQRIGEYYTPECRADLGDARCTVNLASFTDTGVVSTLISPVSFRVDLAGNPVDGFYSLGVLTWTSGLNNGFSMEVLSQAAHDATLDNIRLSLGMPNAIQVGDTFSIVAGCDKRLATCISKFNNVLNFRGEPHVPGDDLINERPFTDTPSGPSGAPAR